jgi:murein DD-endopeptidase MepM/ murein hydrolase activator NlpD
MVITRADKAKKLAAAILTAAMICTISVPVSAAEVKDATTTNAGLYSSTTASYRPLSTYQASASVTSKKSTATVTWESLGDVEGYEVYQYKSGSGKWTLAATTDADTTTYTAKSLSRYHKYYYKVRAYVGEEDSSFSDLQVTGYIITDSWSSGTLAWPVPATHHISSYYGHRTAPTRGASTYHRGIDVGVSSGTTVVASADGTVVATGYSSARGKYVLVKHANGLMTRYQHLSKSLVSKGATVLRGQPIAKSGNTGISTGSHLHYEVLKNGHTVNPLNYIKR